MYISHVIMCIYMGHAHMHAVYGSTHKAAHGPSKGAMFRDFVLYKLSSFMFFIRIDWLKLRWFYLLFGMGV